MKTLEEFINENADIVDQAIKDVIIHDIKNLTNEHRKMWILSDERLKNWIKSQNIIISEKEKQNG